MRRLLRRGAPPPAATPAAGAAGSGAPGWRRRLSWRALRSRRALIAEGSAACGALVLALVALPGLLAPPPGPGPAVAAVRASAAAVPASQAPSSAAPAAQAGGVPFRQIILPDVVVIEPNGLSQAQTAQLGKIHGVRKVLAVDGARITANGRPVNVIGVDPQLFRSWTPLRTASDSRLWSALGGREFLASQQLRKRLGLHPGARYQLIGGTTQDLAFGGSGQFGVAGIDLVVSNRASAGLGLIHNVAALISAPGAGMTGLVRQVRAVVGGGGTVTDVRQQQLPTDQIAAGVKPSNYLQLFKASAAEYCPGLSWTVLAAIGQIESGDGANVGPSSAGALGPMQFMPSTWARWGITAFGEPGPPNVMDPYDAVPSAARYLCASGGGSPSGVYSAIYAYNHADWYVREVLALAQQYASQYG